MKQPDFLAMIAFENGTAGTDLTPVEYGYESWREMYGEISEVEDFTFTTPTGVEVYRLADDSYDGHTLATVLQREYSGAAWVLYRAKQEGVEYE